MVRDPAFHSYLSSVVEVRNVWSIDDVPARRIVTALGPETFSGAYKATAWNSEPGRLDVHGPRFAANILLQHTSIGVGELHEAMMMHFISSTAGLGIVPAWLPCPHLAELNFHTRMVSSCAIRRTT
jgi:hypothetical protein